MTTDLPDGQISRASGFAHVQPLAEKYFASPFARHSITDSSRPASFEEGRIAIVTNVERGMRWPLVARKTNAFSLRTAKSCGPDAPTLASSCAKRVSRGDGDNKPGSPGRARSKPLKPLRREGRIDPVNLW
jgi:hypothetical protein